MNIGKKDSAEYYFQLVKALAAGIVPEIIKGNFNFAAGLFYKTQGNYKEINTLKIRYAYLY